MNVHFFFSRLKQFFRYVTSTSFNIFFLRKIFLHFGSEKDFLEIEKISTPKKMENLSQEAQ